MINVLFVCLGNICRSPMADAVFQQMVKDAGLEDQIRVDSAGTAGYHVGEQAHRGTLQILRKHNIPYDGRARQLQGKDFDDFDYILAMDSSNLRNIQSRMPSNTTAHISLFLDFAEGVNQKSVPDPYYDGRFQEVFDLVTAGCKGLLAHIRKTHNL